MLEKLDIDELKPPRFILICGEDEVTSRLFYSKIKKTCKDESLNSISLPNGNIFDLLERYSQSTNLFSEQIILFTENLVANTPQSKANTFLKKIEERLKQHQLTLITWEEGLPGYKINYKGEKFKLIEFKFPQTVFNFLESCYPGNLINFLKILERLYKKYDANLLFFTLASHVKKLILVSRGERGIFKYYWQEKKLINQANKWPAIKLYEFYEALFRIDKLIKTSSSPYGYKESLDIIACYFL